MDDGYEIFATLTFDLSDDSLTAVVEQLARHRPETLYPEAWRRLTDELRSRWRTQCGTRVDLSAAVFEDLPEEVQAMLRATRVARPTRPDDDEVEGLDRELGPFPGDNGLKITDVIKDHLQAVVAQSAAPEQALRAMTTDVQALLPR